MKLEKLDFPLTVCQVASVKDINLDAGFYFIGKTAGEISLVCRTEDTPENTIARTDGWRGFCVCGTLDFSLVGTLARLSGVLAQNGISIFAVSTYDTDYVLVREKDFDAAIKVLSENGFSF